MNNYHVLFYMLQTLENFSTIKVFLKFVMFCLHVIFSDKSSHASSCSSAPEIWALKKSFCDHE